MAKKFFSVRRFDANDKAQIDGVLQQFNSLIERRTEAMTPNDRRRYGSVKEKNKLFIKKVKELMSVYPHLMTPGLDWANFDAEYDEREYVSQLILRVEGMLYELQTIKIALDNNNYGISLLDYAYTDILNERGEPGITQKISELAQFFPRPKKTEEEDDTKGEDKDTKDTESTTEEEK